MLPKDREDVICTYCGSKFFLRDTIAKSGIPSIDTMFELAGNALRSRNHAEAYNYFTRILEVSPQNPDAWIGKGIAAGWMSTLANPRILEMLSIFSQSQEYVPKDKSNLYNSKMSEVITDVLSSYYDLSYSHVKEFIQLGSGAWDEFGGRVDLVLSGVDIAIFLNSENSKAVRLGIRAAQTLLEGIKYDDYAGHENTILVNQQYQSQYFSKISEYTNAMKKIEPAYQPPVIQQQKKPDCFIATATMGDTSHPYVVLLRKFRDNRLLGSFWGNVFVETYYKVSPPLANFISKSDWLKSMSLTLLIKPLVNLVELLYKPET
jgi:hypothetical protein